MAADSGRYGTRHAGHLGMDGAAGGDGMNTRPSPCKGCKKRAYACHDTCEAYLAFTADRRRVYHERHLMLDIRAQRIESIEKSIRRSHAKGR